MIALVDCGTGEVEAVAASLEKLHAEYKISNNEIFICNADKIIFPGAGIASLAMRKLHLNNLFSALRMIKQPMLGIGLGMQLMCNFSTEGNVAALGIFPGRVEKFVSPKMHVPHRGWKSVELIKQSLLFNGITSGEKFYFEHSYYIPVDDYSTSISENGILFSASIEYGKYFGVQFHPELSGQAGLTLLKNFVDL